MAAQTPAAKPCAAPNLHLFSGTKEIKATGTALVPKFTLALTKNPACTENITYRIKGAEATLVRARKVVVAPQTLSGQTIDISTWAKEFKPGDQVYVEVVVVEAMGADGKPHPVDFKAGRPYFRWVPAK